MKKYLIILASIILCGCVSTKKVRNQSLEVAKFDITNFNGNYANKADSTKHSAYKELFRQLFPTTFPNKYPEKNYITENSIINLHFDNKKTLIITAIENDRILGKIKLKGKVKGDYFSANRQLFLIPIPIFFYVHEETKIILGNDKNGGLVLKMGNYSINFIASMLSSHLYISQSQFKKIK